jgi:hypothetical protein
VQGLRIAGDEDGRPEGIARRQAGFLQNHRYFGVCLLGAAAGDEARNGCPK